jgi:hypothetical protein
MEKGIVDVELMKGQAPSSSQGKQAANWDDLGSWGKGVLIINAFELSEAFSDQSGFVPLDRTIWVVFNFVHPSATNQCFARWKWSERPSAIVLESL